MKVIKVADESVVEYVEGLTYEVDSRKSIIAFMLEHNMDRSTEAFQQYHKEYREYFAELNIAKAQIERDYVLPASNGKKVFWSLDFMTGELTIEDQEGHDA